MKLWMKRSLVGFLSVITFLGLLGLTSLGEGSAQSNQTYIVDRLTDANSERGGEGSGLAGDLRYAMTHAQSGDSITFNITGTINLSDALPALTQDLSIQGIDGLIVRGGGGNVFSVGSGASVSFSSLSITGGIGNGGGIFNSGVLTLNDVTVQGNKAGDPTNGGGTGAGIWNDVNGILILNNCTVSDNTALGNSSYNPSRGGGIANYGTLTLNNSTVSGNSALEGSGGGISNTLPTSTLTLNNSTLSRNSASGVVGIGSGIDNRGMFNSSNTIIAGNARDDLRGALTSQGHNLIGNTMGGSGFRPDLGDLLNVNPQLDSLKDNGGFTQTHALITGSPAIDRGDDANCPRSDQRGFSRPVDGDGNGTTACDIGAYESGAAPVSTLTPLPGDTMTPTIIASPSFTDTPSLTLTLSPEPVLTDTPTSAPAVTPTSTPRPPFPPCSGAIILVAVVFRMYRTKRILP